MTPSPLALVLCERCGVHPANLPEHDRLCDGCREGRPSDAMPLCERCHVNRCGKFDGTVCNRCRLEAYQAEQEKLVAGIVPRERPVVEVPDEAHTCQALYGARCRWRKVTAHTLKCQRCGAIKRADNRYGYV
jgi:hypothetical protein